MGPVSSGTARVLIIVALVAVGALVLANGFEDEQATSSASPTASATPTQPGSSPSMSTSASPGESPAATPSPNTGDIGIVVLNGTGVTGLAGVAQDMLVGEGYTAPIDPANAPQTGVEVTTVYYRPGENAAQNKADATYISETYFPGSKVAKLGSTFDDLVVDSVTVAIVVGADYAESVAA
jgi:hypothetical protein